MRAAAGRNRFLSSALEQENGSMLELKLEQWQSCTSSPAVGQIHVGKVDALDSPGPSGGPVMDGTDGGENGR